MKFLAIVPILFIAACSAHPASPSPLRETTLTILVMGNRTEAPLAGVPVSLKDVSGSEKLTDGSGRASWSVRGGQEYFVLVCGGRGPHGIPAEGEAEVGWLTSLPEAACGR